MQHIIGMPGHIIMAGMPMLIMDIMRSQNSFIMSIAMPSIGFMVQTIPAGVISHVIWHIISGMGIGIMPPIIGIGIPIMLPIMGIILDIIPGIMFGIMPGIMLAIGFIGICIAGIIVDVLSKLNETAVSIAALTAGAIDRSTRDYYCTRAFLALQGPGGESRHF